MHNLHCLWRLITFFPFLLSYFPNMVSSQGAQSLDPLRTIVAQTKVPTNSNNLTSNFNEYLMNGVISAVDHRSEIAQRDDNHASVIDSFLAKTGGLEPVDEKPLMLDPWVHHYQMAAASVQSQQTMSGGASMADCPSYEAKYEELSSCSLGGVVVGYNNSNININHSEENRSAAMTLPVEKRRRCTDDMREKSIERKQKRMIKNRESAARSRARKQAYTQQLETEVQELKNHNTLLELKLKVEKQIMSSSTRTVPQKAQLRRSNSAMF